MQILLVKKLGKKLNKKIGISIEIQRPPYNWITLGQIISDKINLMIQLTDKNFMMNTKENGDKQSYL